nr:YdcF family protein [Tissierella sp.]
MKIYIKILIALVLCFLISFIFIEGLIIKEAKKTYNEKTDYLFILGAKLYGEKPSPLLEERLKVGVKYLKTYQDVKVVVAGGKGHDELISEAESMKSYLLEEGIEEYRIILEDKSVNTFENIKFGLEKIRSFDEREDIEIIIASSNFHLFRSKFIAKRAGVKAYGLAAKVPPTSIVPSYLREYFAVIKTFFIDK